jgi:hypothetical protein
MVVQCNISIPEGHNTKRFFFYFSFSKRPPPPPHCKKPKMKKRKLLSQMTTEEIVERAIKRFAANDNKVGCPECKKNGGYGW